MNGAEAKIIGQDITVAYGDYVLLKDADFTVNKGDIFFIMGASGGGKSSLLRRSEEHTSELQSQR